MLGNIPDVATLSAPLNQSLSTHKVGDLSGSLGDGATAGGCHLFGLTGQGVE